MADTQENLTLVARLLDHISEPLGRVATRVKETGAVAGSMARGGLATFEQKLTRISQVAGPLDAQLTKISGTLTSKLSGALALAKTGTELLGVAVLGLGIKAQMAFQSATAQVAVFANTSQQAAVGITRQLFSMAAPQSAASEVQAFGALMTTPGTTVDQATAMEKVLNDISAVQQDPSGSLVNLSKVISMVEQTGKLTSRQVRQLGMSNVDSTAMIQQMYPGLSKQAATQFISGGAGGFLAAAPFLHAMMSESGPLSKFRGAQSSVQTTTIGGALSKLYNQFTLAIQPVMQPLLTLFITPLKALGTWLAGSGGRTLGRFIDDLTLALTKSGHALGGAGHPLEQLLNTLGKTAPALIPFTIDLIKLSVALLTIGADVASVTAPIVDFLAKVGPVRWAIEGLLVALLAYGALSRLVHGVVAFYDAIKQTLTNMRAGKLAPAVGETVTSSVAEMTVGNMTVTSAVINGVGTGGVPGVAPVPGSPGQPSTGASSRFGKVFRTAAGALEVLPPYLINQQLVDRLAPHPKGHSLVDRVWNDLMHGPQAGAGPTLGLGAAALGAPLALMASVPAGIGYGAYKAGDFALHEGESLWHGLFGGGGHKSKQKDAMATVGSSGPLIGSMTIHVHGDVKDMATVNAVAGSVGKSIRGQLDAAARDRNNRGHRDIYSPSAAPH